MIKLENNWQEKTLENLENDKWGAPPYDSYVVRRTHEIRKLPLASFTNDDIAMMLRQKFSLDYIVPLAIDKLQADILAHGDTGSAGAMMEAILAVPSDFWKSNSEYWVIVKELLDKNKSRWTFENRHVFDSALSAPDEQ